MFKVQSIVGQVRTSENKTCLVIEAGRRYFTKLYVVIVTRTIMKRLNESYEQRGIILWLSKMVIRKRVKV